MNIPGEKRTSPNERLAFSVDWWRVLKYFIVLTLLRFDRKCHTFYIQDQVVNQKLFIQIRKYHTDKKKFSFFVVQIVGDGFVQHDDSPPNSMSAVIQDIEL